MSPNCGPLCLLLGEIGLPFLSGRNAGKDIILGGMFSVPLDIQI